MTIEIILKQIDVPQPEQDKILSTLNSQPSDAIKKRCQTEIQQCRYEEERKEFQTLYHKLKAYFSGQTSQLDTEALEDGTNRFSVWAGSLLARYDLIRYSWKTFEENKECFPIPFPYETPGEVICALIDDLANAHMEPCLSGRCDIKRDKLYRLNAKQRKFLKQLNFGNYYKVTKDLSNYFGSLRQKYLLLHLWVIYFCNVAALGNESVKHKLKAYNSLANDLDRLWTKKWRNTPGYAYEKGGLLKTQKNGGTYIKTDA